MLYILYSILFLFILSLLYLPGTDSSFIPGPDAHLMLKLSKTRWARSVAADSMFLGEQIWKPVFRRRKAPGETGFPCLPGS
jgi:hypothetical protein